MNPNRVQISLRGRVRVASSPPLAVSLHTYNLLRTEYTYEPDMKNSTRTPPQQPATSRSRALHPYSQMIFLYGIDTRYQVAEEEMDNRSLISTQNNDQTRANMDRRNLAYVAFTPSGQSLRFGGIQRYSGGTACWSGLARLYRRPRMHRTHTAILPGEGRLDSQA